MEYDSKIRSTERFFINDSLFVEYLDVIKSPYFMILVVIAATGGEVLRDPFDKTILKGKELEDVLEWFYTRNNQNPMIDLLQKGMQKQVKISDLNRFINNQVTDKILECTNSLNFVNVLKTLGFSGPDLFKKIYIWYPEENEYIMDDIKQTFVGIDGIQILFGPLQEVLEDVKEESITYVFSDITNINALVETNRLNFSSILLAEDYAYNKDERGELLIDIEKLMQKYTFKFDRFIASFDVEMEENEDIINYDEG